MTTTQITTKEMPVAELTGRRQTSLGLPSGLAGGERRFPLTPEGAALLTDRGVDVRIEQGAGSSIHYADSAYERSGVHVGPRADCLRADAVISLAPLSLSETASLRRGTLLLTLSHSVTSSKAWAEALLRAGVNVVALDLVEADGGHKIFADILHEIDGCASMAIASALLTDPVHGKGILLGGVTGIVPCEVTVLGSGMGAIAAAHNALGLGATVRMFDNDLYSLRQASRVLNQRVIASALHPHVLEGALRSADVVVATPMTPPFQVDSAMVELMKRRALVFDLNPVPGHVFPSLPVFDLGEIEQRSLAATTARACYFNVGCQVPRTAAMALSNALISNLDLLLSANEGQLRGAILLWWGKAVSPRLAEMLGVRPLDFNLLSNVN